jgi:hypothetical protein
MNKKPWCKKAEEDKAFELVWFWPEADAVIFLHPILRGIFRHLDLTFLNEFWAD